MGLWLKMLRRLTLLASIKYQTCHKCRASVDSATNKRGSRVCPRSSFCEREQPTHPSSSKKEKKNNRNKQTKVQAQMCNLTKLETGRKSCRVAKLRDQVLRLAGATLALSSSVEEQKQL